MSGGTIVQVIGAVVDVEFPRDAMPKVFDALTVDNTDIMLEVQQQLGDGVVRTIALGSTDGLKRGIPVTSTGAAISVPVGEKTLGRVMDVMGRPIDEAGPIAPTVCCSGTRRRHASDTTSSRVMRSIRRSVFGETLPVQLELTDPVDSKGRE